MVDDDPMFRLTTDAFVEAFAAMLVQRGQRHVRLNEPAVRDQLFRVYEFLEPEVDRTDGGGSWTRSLVNIRNLFRPSPIGAFDEFESLMREKQIYLTEHPNPYYKDIAIKLPAPAAASIVKSLDTKVRELVSQAVTRYMEA